MNETGIKTEIEQLNDRIRTLEETTQSGPVKTDSAFTDPELVHKIVHACMGSDSITESEELRILRELLD